MFQTDKNKTQKSDSGPDFARRYRSNRGKASELDEDMEDPLEPREDMEAPSLAEGSGSGFSALQCFEEFQNFGYEVRCNGRFA